MEALREGATHRSTGHTNMNAHSSRSHLILTVHCQGHELIEGGKVYDARLNLVDLAGSERVNKSAVKGAALLEAQAINKSLSSLGDVIQALGEKKKKGGHVPFRNSKLTYILEKSLSQGSKVRSLSHARTLEPCESDFWREKNPPLFNTPHFASPNPPPPPPLLLTSPLALARLPSPSPLALALTLALALIPTLTLTLFPRWNRFSWLQTALPCSRTLPRRFAR